MTTPLPMLQDYRLDQKGRLILFLALDGVYFTRRIKLGSYAGMNFYQPEQGVASFSYGWEKQPTVNRLTRNDGVRIKLIRHKLKRPFMVKASLDLLERLAAEAWPLMDLDTNKRPKAYSLEDVQPVQLETLAEAAD